MSNRIDPDQLASEEANWSGSILFERQYISGFSRTRVNSFRTLNKSILRPLDVSKLLGEYELEFYGPVNTVKVSRAGHLTYSHFSWTGLVLKVVNQYPCMYFANN